MKKTLIIAVLAILVLIPAHAEAASFTILKDIAKLKLQNFIFSGNFERYPVAESDRIPEPEAVLSHTSFIHNNSLLAFHIPDGHRRRFIGGKVVYEVTATAYSSTPEQTDATPFITASGTYVRDGVVAANFLPIGTVFKIPALYGDKTFIVEDRMNKRYYWKIDIWFSSKQEARKFGVKSVLIEIVS